MNGWEPPILLTYICSSWRNIAHATQLWKSIHIAAPCHRSSITERRNFSSTTQAEHTDRCSEAVLEWLSRSAAYPLDISLGPSHWGGSVVAGFCDKLVIGSFIQFSERWRDVRLSAPSLSLATPRNTLTHFQSPFTGNFLSLNFLTDHRYPRASRKTSEVLQAPKLRDLWLHGVWLSQLMISYRDGDVTRLPVNWSQLTNFSLEGSACGKHWDLFDVLMAYKLLSLMSESNYLSTGNWQTRRKPTSRA